MVDSSFHLLPLRDSFPSSFLSVQAHGLPSPLRPLQEAFGFCLSLGMDNLRHVCPLYVYSKALSSPLLPGGTLERLFPSVEYAKQFSPHFRSPPPPSATFGANPCVSGRRWLPSFFLGFFAFHHSRVTGRFRCQTISGRLPSFPSYCWPSHGD